ncbi:hypothetical protein ACQP2F_46460 (plasmid) [Actinoplanes sp. CA-030573]|uniref:hypothetical protein n=1 Tax=Actinoplanes sp. CA-030573 TaxID=3239898 RepID=UPI003D8A3233
MITGRGSGWRDRAARLSERYDAWEARRLTRLSGWTVRRRYVTFVLAPLLLCCCGGGVLGVPVVWFLRTTIEAGRGEVSPDAAANSYLMALGYGQEEGLLALLDDEHQGELLEQWKAYRAEMTGTDPPPAKLDFGTLTVGPIHDHRAEVTTDVAASWAQTDENGRLQMYRSQAYQWRIETREDDGWRVSVVHAPAWCGGYVLAAHCH